MLHADAVGELAMYFPFVRALGALEAADLAQRAEPVAAARGAPVADDAPPARLILLTGGCVRMTAARGKGRAGAMLYRVQAGEACGVTAAALLDGVDFGIAGAAETDVHGVQLAKPDFLDLIESLRGFRQFVFHRIAVGVGALLCRLRDTREQTLAARLAEALVTDAPAIHRTHQDLANELGTAREVVTRLLAELAERGIVRLRRGEIWVENIDALRRDAERARGRTKSHGALRRAKRRR